MLTPVEIFLGWRYTRARRRSKSVSLISSISIAGVAIGIAALITILSVMNGFERELRERILGMAAHLTLTSDHGGLGAWKALTATLRAQAGVRGVAPFVDGEALMTQYNNVQGVLVRGVLPAAEASVSTIQSTMQAGDFNALTPGAFNIILGRGLAESVQAVVGSQITLVLPEPIRVATGMVPRLRRFTVVGIFEAGVQEYDSATAYVHIEDAAKLFRVRDGVGGLRLKLDNAFAATGLKTLLRAQALVGDEVKLTDWTETHVNLFRALKTEKIVMFVILALSIGVAAFNLVSTLVMVVSEKYTEVAILRTLGMTPRRVLTVFLVQGAFIGAAGIALGVGAGVLLAANVERLVGAVERLFGFKFLPADVYYISEIPSQLAASDVLIAIGLAVVLCLVAPLYPAWLASRTNPAEALRYE